MNLKLKNDPFYFDALTCEDCGSKEDVYAHRFNDNVKCLICVNKLMMAAQVQKEEIYLIPIRGENKNE